MYRLKDYFDHHWDHAESDSGGDDFYGE